MVTAHDQKNKVKGARVRSFSDLDSFQAGAKHADEENEEPYRELKQALTELNLLRFFGTLTAQGFGEIETILATDPIVLTALTGMTDDEAIDVLDQVDVCYYWIVFVSFFVCVCMFVCVLVLLFCVAYF